MNGRVQRLLLLAYSKGPRLQATPELGTLLFAVKSTALRALCAKQLVSSPG